MPHTEDVLEWHVDGGSQDFLVRFSRDDIPAGQIIASIISIRVQRRTSMKPEVWQDIGKAAATQAIVANDFDPDNPLPNAAVYWTADADGSNDPVPDGGPYRWLVHARLDTVPAIDIFGKPDLIVFP